jgi:hypothetical protein
MIQVLFFFLALCSTTGIDINNKNIPRLQKNILGLFDISVLAKKYTH